MKVFWPGGACGREKKHCSRQSGRVNMEISFFISISKFSLILINYLKL
jgi:hypothetical protein